MARRSTAIRWQSHHSSVGNRYHDDNEDRPQSKSSSRFGQRNEEHSEATQARLKELKKAVLAGVKEFDLEQYRKSDEELRSFKNKELRHYYEAQNAKLDDWLDVDMLVYALADDVLDSMDVDANRDGLVDRLGPLQGTGEDLESFLPEKERVKRQKDNRRERLAINVSTIRA